MWIKREQLVIDNVLLTAIVATSGNTIIPGNTVLNEEHIKIINYFLIDRINVSEELASGKQFIPKGLEKTKAVTPRQEEEVELLPFYEKYQRVVHQYKEMFIGWQSGLAIDMAKVRRIFLPLLEEMEEAEKDLYALHTWSTKEDYLYHHAVSVGLLAAFTAKKLDYDKGNQIQLGLAGLLSDSGMAKLNPSIFLANRSLYMREQEDIFHHPGYSYRLVESIPTLSREAKLAILQHHERNNESGYPFKLGKDKIHPYAHIIAISDIYHAMTSSRIYQEEVSPFLVLEKIFKKRNIKLNNRITDTFIKSILPLRINTEVLLSNGKKGIVAHLEAENPLRPVIKLADKEFFQLKDYPNLHIEKIIG